MKFFRKFLIVLFAFVLTLLDVSFFSNLTVGGSTIISTYVFITIFSLIGDSSISLVFSLSCVLFFVAFSSVPLFSILLLFFVFPAIIVYLRKNYFPEPSVLLSAIFFLVANLVLELFMLFNAKEFSEAALQTLLYFVIINSIFGVIAFYFTKRIRKKFGREMIKI